MPTHIFRVVSLLSNSKAFFKYEAQKSFYISLERRAAFCFAKPFLRCYL